MFKDNKITKKNFKIFSQLIILLVAGIVVVAAFSCSSGGSSSGGSSGGVISETEDPDIKDQPEIEDPETEDPDIKDQPEIEDPDPITPDDIDDPNITEEEIAYLLHDHNDAYYDPNSSFEKHSHDPNLTDYLQESDESYHVHPLDELFNISDHDHNQESSEYGAIGAHTHKGTSTNNTHHYPSVNGDSLPNKNHSHNDTVINIEEEDGHIHGGDEQVNHFHDPVGDIEALAVHDHNDIYPDNHQHPNYELNDEHHLVRSKHNHNDPQENDALFHSHGEGISMNLHSHAIDLEHGSEITNTSIDIVAEHNHNDPIADGHLHQNGHIHIGQRSILSTDENEVILGIHTDHTHILPSEEQSN